MFNTVTPDATSEGSPRMMIIIFLVYIPCKSLILYKIVKRYLKVASFVNNLLRSYKEMDNMTLIGVHEMHGRVHPN